MPPSCPPMCAFSFRRCPKNGNWIHASMEFLFVTWLFFWYGVRGEGWGGVVQTVRIAHSHHVLHFIIFHSLYDCLACTHIHKHKHAVDHLCFCVCIGFWNLFPLCTIIADIACTFCCYSFHISYTHNTWFHLNHFLANCDEVIPIATGPASYCMRMRMWRQNPLNGRTICPKHCAINVILFIFIQTFQSSSLFLFSLSHPCHCM